MDLYTFGALVSRNDITVVWCTEGTCHACNNVAYLFLDQWSTMVERNKLYKAQSRKIILVSAWLTSTWFWPFSWDLLRIKKIQNVTKLYTPTPTERKKERKSY